MDNYKEMYLKLFNQITDVINELETAQKKTEEMYISQEQNVLSLLKEENKKELH